MEENIEINHKRGLFNIITEHKFLIISISIIAIMFVFKDNIEKDFVMLFILLATLLFFFSLFVELPHSRYTLLQIIGHAAWYIAIFSSLFFGWLRWANPD